MASAALLSTTISSKMTALALVPRSLGRPSSPGRTAMAIAQPIRATSSNPSQSVTDEQNIEGLNRDYCDDFVCTSSPSVESTVRSFARDIARGNSVFTKSLLSRNVEYSDTFRRFRGIDGYQKMNFMTKFVQGATATVAKLRMEGSGTAVIEWRLTGTLGPFPIDVDMTSTITMNLLTGQIEKHVDSWSLRRCSPPAAMAWTAARWAWALSAGGADAAKTTNTFLDSLTSMDESDDTFTQANPNDPMRFFQQKDSFKEDATAFVGFLLVMYIVVQGFAIIFKG